MSEQERLLPPTGTIQPSDSGRILTRRTSDTRLTTVTYSVGIVLMGSLLFGFAIGYSSPVISDLQGNSTKAERKVQEHPYLKESYYQGIFSALMPLGALVGAPIAAWLVDYVGRKKSLLLCSVPLAIGWLITVLSYLPGHHHVVLVRVLLFVGRFIVGIGVGSVSLCIPMYITEISPTSLRGLYGAGSQLCITIGVFGAEMVGTYIKYYWLAMLPLGVTCVFAVFSLSLRETPRWLISKGRNLEAGRVLLWLRGNNYDVANEQREIEDQVHSERNLTFSETIQEFKTRPVYHPLILALFLMAFQQFSGINAVIFNAEDTFDGVTNRPGLVSSFAVGLTQVLATFVGVILTDILGRRILLISGAIIMCVSISVAGGYEYLDHQKDNNIAAMGIAGIVCYIIGFSIGWGALPWLLSSEIIPLRVRGTGVGIATFVNWLLAAFVTGVYKYYQNEVRYWFAFWSFGLVCLCAAIFTAIFIPETKSKSLEDIEKSFEASSVQRSSEL